MNSIGIHFHPDEAVEVGGSKWWGDPDLPADIDYPTTEDGPMLFLCQIRLSDIADLDTQSLLPHSGMLYFFANIAEYVENLDMAQENHNSLGEWSNDSFVVLYSPECEALQPFRILYEDGEPVALPAERLTFSVEDANYDGFKLLGRPYYDEVHEEYPEHISLLQIDEEERWGLRLYDCGMLNFMILPAQLKQRFWDRARLYFHSF